MKHRSSITAIAVTFFLLLATAVQAEQLSKIAVININRIFESYPEESRVFRQMDELRKTYEDRMAEYAHQLDDIELSIIEAKDAANDLEVTRLNSTRDDFINDRRTYHDIMSRRLREAYREIAEGEGIVQQILKAIEFVAIGEGYSAVLDADDTRLWWFSKEIDITDLVINRLRAIAR